METLDTKTSVVIIIDKPFLKIFEIKAISQSPFYIVSTRWRANFTKETATWAMERQVTFKK